MLSVVLFLVFLVGSFLSFNNRNCVVVSIPVTSTKNIAHDAIKHTDIFVGEFVSEPNPLWLMFDRPSVNDGMLELFEDRLVDGVTLQRVRSQFSCTSDCCVKGREAYEIFNRASILFQHDRCRIVRRFPLGFGINPF